MIVPAEYRSTSSRVQKPEELDSNVHPISGIKRRFILGDRFHNSTQPHKSPLCLFHNIDLCAQGATISTSYQEAENSRKNMKRLSSATLQGFGLHFFYNLLMDFYQNEEIVKQQQHRLSKQLGGGQCIVRDELEYHRFTVVDAPH